MCKVQNVVTATNAIAIIALILESKELPVSAVGLSANLRVATFFVE